MRRLSIVLVLCLACGPLLAQQTTQRGRIKKVDTDKGLVTITTPDGKVVEAATTPQTVIHDANNQDIADFRRNGLPAGTNVLFRAEQRGDRLVLTGLKVPGQAGAR